MITSGGIMWLSLFFFCLVKAYNEMLWLVPALVILMITVVGEFRGG